MNEINHHPLRPIINDILEHATPENERPTLERLLINIVLYIKGVETGKLTPEERKFPAHRNFHFLSVTPSTYFVESLYQRLRIIKNYNIHSVDDIQEILLYGFTRVSQKSLTNNQVAILRLLSENPLLRTQQLSQQLGFSRPTVNKLLHQLRNDFGLRLGHLSDLSKLKLTTFSLVFHTKSYNDSRNFEKWVRSTNSPFLKSLVFDVSYRYGYLVYAVPSQQRAFEAFTQRVAWLNQKFLDRIQLHRCLELRINMRYDDYSTKLGRWLIPTELAHHSIEALFENPSFDVSKSQLEIKFGLPVPFTRVDFLISMAEAHGAHKLKEKCQFLQKFGFNLSTSTVWSHFTRLKKLGVLIPYTYFSGAGFEEFICLSVICDNNTQVQLLALANHFPFTNCYLTDQGIAIFLKRPGGWQDVINRLIRDIAHLKGVSDFLVVYQERNIGTGLDIELFRHWNEKRQFWEFTNQNI